MTPKFLNETYSKKPFPTTLCGKKISPEVFAEHLKMSFFAGLEEIYHTAFSRSPKASKLDQKVDDLTTGEMKKILGEFVKKFPIDHIESLECGISSDWCQITDTNGSVSLVAVLPFQSFFGNKKEGRMTRLDLWIKAASIEADAIVVVLPWKRNQVILSTGFSPVSRTIVLSALTKAKEITEKSKGLWSAWPEIYENNHFIGHHRRKESLNEILSIAPRKARPFQIFLLGNRGNKGEGPVLDTLAETYPDTFSKYRGYVHAPYSLSLARKNVSRDSSSPSIIFAAQKYLETSKKMGFKGIVFHVDKSPDLEQAKDNLRNNLNELLPFISEGCPILLENSCGDGNKFMSTPEEMAQVCSEYPSDLVKVCLDICHAHGAGYDPLDYISSMCFGNGEDGYQVQYHHRIGLIHLNGAIKQRGCYADGHATMSRGQHLTLNEVEYVLDYARCRNLSCIIE